jgi:hypothetical protein
MLRHDANRITGRHSDIRCTATPKSQPSIGADDRAPGVRIACSLRQSRHMLQATGARAGCLHGLTRLEGMISMIARRHGARAFVLQGW